MNTQTTVMPQSSFQSPWLADMEVTWPMYYWSVRRELWENRSIYLAPLAAAAVFLVGFMIRIVALSRRLNGLGALDTAGVRDVLITRYEIAATLIMGTAFIVGIFYSLDALYGERRDRSILFWKSLPVSDLTAVLSKVTIPLLVLPLLSFAITVATQFVMLFMTSAMLLASGANVAALWTQVSFVHVSGILFYHLLTVHGLWYAPIYGWLLLVSAWAPRAPFIWAFLPPFVICGVEKIAFNTTHFLRLLQGRLSGQDLSGPTAPDTYPMGSMSNLIPTHFFSAPGLWIGLAIAAAFLFAAVRLRRYRGPA